MTCARLAALLAASLSSLAAQPSQQTLDDFTALREWHFEFRFTPQQRAEYQKLLAADYPRLAAELDAASPARANWKRSDWLSLAMHHSQQRQKDSVEISTEAILNNGQIHGDGLAAQLRRQVKPGLASARFLDRVLQDYSKPLSGDGNIHTSLFRRHTDAAFEWTAFRITITAGKRVIAATESDRDAMRDQIVRVWNEQPGRRGELRGWLDAALSDWLIWRLGDYSFFTRMSPYQQKEQLVAWGREVVASAPALQPFLDRRIDEWKQHAAAMTAGEVRAEFERKKNADTRFAIAMQQMQSSAKDAASTAQQMRQGLLTWHVTNLNISANAGNSPYVWKIAEVR